jgi:hypothetical protein
MATPKSSFGDGVSGAPGNQAQAQSSHLGPNLAQKFGSYRDPSSVPGGGPILKQDAPSDRGGLVGQDAPSLGARRPFKLGSFTPTPAPSADDASSASRAPVGAGPDEDTGGSPDV